MADMSDQKDYVYITNNLLTSHFPGLALEWAVSSMNLRLRRLPEL